jgi:two-component system response regulator AlgR
MRVLIVDDSPTARAQARAALEGVEEQLKKTFVIDEAGSGVEALRALASDAIDVLVVDLHMPDMTGLEVLAFWRQRVAAADGTIMQGKRAMVVSTDVSSRDKEKALSSGAHRFLEKPVSVDAIAEALQGLPL